MPTWTCVFYVFVALVAILPMLFIWSIWHLARERGWSYINADTRDMYVDGAKTLITASGIAVALLASSGVASAKIVLPLVAFSAKVAAVSLISCVCLSLVVILALLRGFEVSWSRKSEEMLARGAGPSADGQLNRIELICILLPAGLALSSFLVGFVFLGRIAFHF
jgi:hypothetical protein